MGVETTEIAPETKILDAKIPDAKISDKNKGSTEGLAMKVF